MNNIEVTGKKDTRSGFGDGLTELGKTNPNVVALCGRFNWIIKNGGFQS